MLITKEFIDKIMEATKMCGGSAGTKVATANAIRVIITAESKKITIIGNESLQHFIAYELDFSEDERDVITEDMDFVVSPDKFAPLLERFETGVLYLQGDKLVFKRSKNKAGLQVISEDYPEFKLMKKNYTEITVNSQTIANALSETEYALYRGEEISRQVSRHYSFNVSDGILSIQSTDSNRAAYIEMSINSDTEITDEITVVISNFINKIFKSVKSVDENIRIRISKKKIEIFSSGFAATFPTIQGEQKDLRPVIKKVKEGFLNTAFLQISSEALKGFLKAAEKLTKGDNIKKPIILDVTEEGVTVSVEGTVGRFEEFTGTEKDGEKVKPITIGFSSKYLLDTLSEINKGEDVRIFLNTPLTPALFESENLKGTHILLPVMLQNTVNKEDGEDVA